MLGPHLLATHLVVVIQWTRAVRPLYALLLLLLLVVQLSSVDVVSRVRIWVGVVVLLVTDAIMRRLPAW